MDRITCAAEVSNVSVKAAVGGEVVGRHVAQVALAHHVRLVCAPPEVSGVREGGQTEKTEQDDAQPACFSLAGSKVNLSGR